jgi:Protein of unknown function (DUF1524)
MLLPWRRLAITALAVVALLLAGERLPASEAAPSPAWATSAAKLLADLQVKPPASMAGYSRDRFGSPWKDTNRNGCDTRDDILRLDLRLVQYKAGSDCVIATGTLNDPYTGTKINFVRGVGTSSAVQIDHVVALADAWRTGARTWSAARRLHYANDPSVLLAVDGPRTRPRGTTTLRVATRQPALRLCLRRHADLHQDGVPTVGQSFRVCRDGKHTRGLRRSSEGAEAAVTTSATLEPPVRRACGRAFTPGGAAYDGCERHP